MRQSGRPSSPQARIAVVESVILRGVVPDHLELVTNALSRVY